MAIKKVVILHDENYTKAQILDDLRGEGFRHKYKFISDVETEMVGIYLDESDEVWTFGDVEDMIEYRAAKALGCDIWGMG